MQFEALEVFCDVARNRSFSQAALLNGVTQSAVSQMVAQLEKKMGVQLIDRSTRPLQLTPLGKRYYDGCKNLLDEYHELVASLRSAQAQVEGTVQIAAIYSVGLGNMGQYVEEFIAKAPDAEVHIEYLHPNQVYEKVLEGSVDIGLVSFPRKMAKLTVHPWRAERMLLACPPSHRLAANSAVKVSDLQETKYIHFSKELVVRREVDRFFRARRVNVDVALEFDTIENIKQAVQISAGIALLPEPTFRKEVDNGTLVAVPLDGVEFSRPLGIIHRRQHKLSMAAQGFLDLLASHTDIEDPVLEDGAHAGGTDHKRLPHSSTNGNGSHRNGAGSPKSNGRNRQTT